VKRILIALDAGHGGSDPGAMGNGLTEAQLTLDLATGRFTHMARAAGHQATPIRVTDEALALDERVRRALSSQANLFLSFHINAAASLARGFQVWYHGGDQRSQKIATRLRRMVADALPQWAGNASRIAADTERYANGFAVLRGTWQHMPALLLEVGFISNASDAALLRDPVFKQATVLQIVAGISACIAHAEL